MNLEKVSPIRPVERNHDIYRGRVRTFTVGPKWDSGSIGCARVRTILHEC